MVTRTQQRTFWTIWLLMGLVFLAAFFRFHDLGAESYWKDETVMAHVTSYDLGTLIRHFQTDARPPVYVLMGHLWQKLFGTNDAISRVLPALWGILAIPLLYRVGAFLFNRQIGFTSAALLTIAPYHIYWSQTIRYYSLLLAFTLLAGFFYIRALKHKKPFYLLPYALFSILIVYTQPFGVFILSAWGVYFLLMWRSFTGFRKFWIASQAFIIGGIIPTFLTWMRRVQVVDTGAISEDTHSRLPDSLWKISKPLRDFLFLDDRRVGYEEIGQSILILAVGVLIFIFWRGKDRWLAAAKAFVTDSRHLWGTPFPVLLLTLCWFIIPLVMAFLFSWVVDPIYRARYVIMALPALFILIAWISYSARKIMPIVLPIGIIMFWQASALHTYYVETYNEDWRSAAAYVQANAQPNDSIAITPESMASGFNNSFYWYYPAPTPACPFDLVDDSNTTIETQLVNCLQTNQGDRIWLVVPTWSVEDVDERMTALINQMPHLTLQDQAAFYKVNVYLFSPADTQQLRP